jgi:hypothetical protein
VEAICFGFQLHLHSLIYASKWPCLVLAICVIYYAIYLHVQILKHEWPARWQSFVPVAAAKKVKLFVRNWLFCNSDILWMVDCVQISIVISRVWILMVKSHLQLAAQGPSLYVNLPSMNLSVCVIRKFSTIMSSEWGWNCCVCCIIVIWGEIGYQARYLMKLVIAHLWEACKLMFFGQLM